jgi:hypothetical protein
MTVSLITHLVAFLLGTCAGGWLGYRWGARIAADVTIAKDAVKKL